jgi:hypothetical protein
VAEPSPASAPASDADIAQFCRLVEEHLTRVNEGHLVRIVGMGFELVRSWAMAGIPLSIVCHGISLKAARHRQGRSKRPLRVEFCEIDVREVYDGWRRAVGLPAEAPGGDPGDADEVPPAEHRRPSLTRHLDRVFERLSRFTGRLDLPDAFRAALNPLLEALIVLRERAPASRGADRAAAIAQLAALDDALAAAARQAVAREDLASLDAEAARELSPFRSRLTPESWQQSVALGADRLLRDRLGLPTLALE